MISGQVVLELLAAMLYVLVSRNNKLLETKGSTMCVREEIVLLYTSTSLNDKMVVRYIV